MIVLDWYCVRYRFSQEVSQPFFQVLNLNINKPEEIKTFGLCLAWFVLKQQTDFYCYGQNLYCGEFVTNYVQ